MAREAGDIAWELGYSPIYVARGVDEMESFTFPGEVMLESDIDKFLEIPFVIGIGDNLVRQGIAKRFANRIRFLNLIHPSATFGYGQRQGIESKQGVIVCAGVHFTNNIQIGNFSVFNLGSTISHDVVIDDFVFVASGVHISGNVYIASHSWIGPGVVVNQGSNEQKLEIGSGAVIGYGAVVLKNCEPNSVYVGVPARRVK